jgi:hypothetical protein
MSAAGKEDARGLVTAVPQDLTSPYFTQWLEQTLEIASFPKPETGERRRRHIGPKPAMLLLILLHAAALMPAPMVGLRVNSCARLGVPMLKSSEGDDKQEVPPVPTMSPEREAFDRGEGNIFFQSPAPRTGNQNGMSDFFSKENFAEAGEIPLQGKVQPHGHAVPSAHHRIHIS